ncbi:MAG: hypothetical protein AAGA90_18955 [Actinomycetota bacterium]
MPTRTRRLVLAVLLMLGIIGGVLVLTASEDGPPLTEVVTEDRLVTEIPEGWVQSEQFAFEWQPEPEGVAQVFDTWRVARACGPDGCAARTLDEWLAVGQDLPTFVQALEPESGLEIVRDEFGSDYRVLEAGTVADSTFVFVAAFTDGADFYVECGAAIGITGDERLIDELVEVCRATEEVGG